MRRREQALLLDVSLCLGVWAALILASRLQLYCSVRKLLNLRLCITRCAAGDFDNITALAGLFQQHIAWGQLASPSHICRSARVRKL